MVWCGVVSQGAAPTEELRIRALEFAMGDTVTHTVGMKVKLQDSLYLALSMAAGGLEAQESCWRFFTSNFQRYVDKDMGASLMDAVVQGACAHFASTSSYHPTGTLITIGLAVNLGSVTTHVTAHVRNGCGSVIGSGTDTAEGVALFFKEHPLPRNTRKIKQILEGITTKSRALANLQASRAMEWLRSPPVASLSMPMAAKPAAKPPPPQALVVSVQPEPEAAAPIVSPVESSAEYQALQAEIAALKAAHRLEIEALQAQLSVAGEPVTVGVISLRQHREHIAAHSRKLPMSTMGEAAAAHLAQHLLKLSE